MESRICIAPVIGKKTWRKCACVLLWVVYLILNWDKISCSPDRSWSCRISEVNLELPILLPSPLKYCNSRFSVENQTQGLSILNKHSTTWVTTSAPIPVLNRQTHPSVWVASLPSDVSETRWRRSWKSDLRRRDDLLTPCPRHQS